jgi:hypothetical protein
VEATTGTRDPTEGEEFARWAAIILPVVVGVLLVGVVVLIWWMFW